MIFEICAVVATIVLIILIFYMIRTLKTMERSLSRFNEIFVKIETKIDPLSCEATTLLQSSNDLIKNVDGQLQAFDPLLQTISHLGNVIQKATHSWKEDPSSFSAVCAEKEKQQEGTSAHLVELALLAMIVWQQLKKRR